MHVFTNLDDSYIALLPLSPNEVGNCNMILCWDVDTSEHLSILAVTELCSANVLCFTKNTYILYELVKNLACHVSVSSRPHATSARSELLSMAVPRKQETVVSLCLDVHTSYVYFFMPLNAWTVGIPQFVDECKVYPEVLIKVMVAFHTQPSVC